MHARGRAGGGGRGGGGERVKVRFPLGQSTMGKITVRFQRTLHPEGENRAVLTRDCPCSYKKTRRPVSSALRVQLQLVMLLKYLAFFLHSLSLSLVISRGTLRDAFSSNYETLEMIVTRSGKNYAF